MEYTKTLIHITSTPESSDSMYSLICLKADGLLTTYLQEESGGPPRKYYSLTTLGKETFEKDCSEYLLFADSVKKMLEDDRND